MQATYESCLAWFEFEKKFGTIYFFLHRMIHLVNFFSNLDWADCPISCNSLQVIVFFWGRLLFYGGQETEIWILSSAEAEHRAMANTYCELS